MSDGRDHEAAVWAEHGAGTTSNDAAPIISSKLTELLHASTWIQTPQQLFIKGKGRHAKLTGRLLGGHVSSMESLLVRCNCQACSERCEHAFQIGLEMSSLLGSTAMSTEALKYHGRCNALCTSHFLNMHRFLPPPSFSAAWMARLCSRCWSGLSMRAWTARIRMWQISALCRRKRPWCVPGA
eukprot:1161599-Pelagomonas_calceolata.AAC.11